jgi:IS30 family transposase
VKSITADNGPEKAEHALIAAILNLRFYFCHPYHSWEKGTVENRNGVIRRYLPRKTDLSTWTQTDVDEIAEDINTTPMKCLGYRTPNEVYSELRCTRPCGRI